MKFTLKSFAYGLVPWNTPLVATTKKAMRTEVRAIFPSAEKVLFDKESVCVIGRMEVLRFFIERRTSSGKLRRF